MLPPNPFQDFAGTLAPPDALRARITEAWRRPETLCLPALLAEASLPPAQAQAAAARARELVLTLRRKRREGGTGVEGLIQEYSLSSQEGIALMCLAEALLRIPDAPTRDALIRDKISTADWQAHLGQSPSLFVNAATWGLLITGRLTATSSAGGLTAALTRLIGRGGEPLIRKGVDLGMRMMGEQFVTGQTIEAALEHARSREAQGFRYSYDMLGEAAATAADAARYLAAYTQAIHAIGRAARGHGVYARPGISVKLSALHPRYARAQMDRVRAQLLPRLLGLARLARGYEIGFNIDAEESERLEPSLELLEALCFDAELRGWRGIGFVLQAYQKRCPFVIDWIVDLAGRSGHRLMIRLVKGAYWDSEIKRAQVEGHEEFPVYTRKLHTDVAYLACARRLLAAPEQVYPQFATHNAHSLATIMEMAGSAFEDGQYEFQCLHGMGEPLYEEVVGAERLNRPCRIYAPVGTHATLLAYLVRRLLENGANTSFVNRIADPAVSVDELVADPVAEARRITPLGAGHPAILRAPDLYGAERRNSTGLDLNNERQLERLARTLAAGAGTMVWARPMGCATDATGVRAAGGRAICNPADHRDTVGSVIDATPADLESAVAQAQTAAAPWAATSAAERAAALARAADLLQERLPALLGLLVREAGKSLPNAVGEVREAIDFLRYYGAQLCQGFEAGARRPLGPVACISPWNFPLAIFLGQVAAALAAGNTVLAKPAEETPLIAAAAAQLLYEAGLPGGVLQFLPGDGTVGAALVADARVQGVMFTGSTEVARLIQRQLADRLNADGTAVPLIAETGGQNALIVDSSALPEQVVADVLTSAFDSAGQRCSALRILCLQEDIADPVLAMLRGAMQELCVGNPGRLSTDVGPVISATAQAAIDAHVAAMRARGRPVEQRPLPADTAYGTFVAPTLIEIERLSELTREVFGPVLHVLRYPRSGLDALVDAINGSGYGLTFGLHTRIDETIAQVTSRISAGNLYINRNMIGAVVGVQPFGGTGLSGTGPKAGGPLYLERLAPARALAPMPASAGTAPAPLAAMNAGDSMAARYRDFLLARGLSVPAARVTHYLRRAAAYAARELAGPVGERNLYLLKPRGMIGARAQSPFGALVQVGAILATGNVALVAPDHPAAVEFAALPPDLAAVIRTDADWGARPEVAGILYEGDREGLRELNRRLSLRPGPIRIVQGASVAGLASGQEDYQLALLLEEISISTNTAAAGGNAQLMTIG